MVVRTDWSSSTISSFCIGWSARVGFHNHGKTRTLAGSTGDLNAPAMPENDLLYNRKPDTVAGFAGSLSTLGPVEFLENTFNFLRVHSDSLIFHGQAQLTAAGF